LGTFRRRAAGLQQSTGNLPGRPEGDTILALYQRSGEKMNIISARSFWLPVMVTTLVATFFGALMERESRRYLRLLGEQARLEHELQQVRTQNRQLRTERTEMLTDLGAVERAAREELNLVAPGEHIIVADDVPPPEPAPPALPQPDPFVAEAARPEFTERVMLGALAGSAALFLLWNIAAAAWQRLRGEPAQPGSRAHIAPMNEADTDRKNAA
jgi:cell division protein FtsB